MSARNGERPIGHLAPERRPSDQRAAAKFRALDPQLNEESDHCGNECLCGFAGDEGGKVRQEVGRSSGPSLKIFQKVSCAISRLLLNIPSLSRSLESLLNALAAPVSTGGFATLGEARTEPVRGKSAVLQSVANRNAARCSECSAARRCQRQYREVLSRVCRRARTKPSRSREAEAEFAEKTRTRRKLLALQVKSPSVRAPRSRRTLQKGPPRRVFQSLHSE